MHAIEHITVDEALTHVIEQTQTGNLVATWRAYEVFFNHADREDIDADIFISCFRSSGCFHLDTLANILGKSRTDVMALIRGYCPHFTTWKHKQRTSDFYAQWSEEKFEAEFREAKAGLHRFTGADESCEDWRSRIEKSVSHEALDRSVEPTIWPLKPIPTDVFEIRTNPHTGEAINDSVVNPLSWWPTVTYQLGNTNRNALVDSASSTMLIENDADFLTENFIRTHDEVISTGLREKLTRVSAGYITKMHIAGRKYLGMFAVNVPPDLFNSPIQDIIGMSLLLQYAFVCFDWEEKLLYLGQSGPCEGGIRVGAGLEGDGSLYVPIHTQNTSTTDRFASIDTGADQSFCAPELYSSDTQQVNNQRRIRFEIVQNLNITSTCLLDESARLTSYLDPTPIHAVIGLTTLQEFKAFGWSTSPLELYVVPK